jgi:hypothetical protein
MLELSIMIAIAIITKQMVLFGTKIRLKLFTRKPFSCVKCIGFWTNILAWIIIGQPELILPSYLLLIFYDNQTFTA